MTKLYVIKTMLYLNFVISTYNGSGLIATLKRKNESKSRDEQNSNSVNQSCNSNLWSKIAKKKLEEINKNENKRINHNSDMFKDSTKFCIDCKNFASAYQDKIRFEGKYKKFTNQLDTLEIEILRAKISIESKWDDDTEKEKFYTKRNILLVEYRNSFEKLFNDLKNKHFEFVKLIIDKVEGYGKIKREISIQSEEKLLIQLKNNYDLLKPNTLNGLEKNLVDFESGLNKLIRQFVQNTKLFCYQGLFSFDNKILQENYQNSISVKTLNNLILDLRKQKNEIEDVFIVIEQREKEAEFEQSISELLNIIKNNGFEVSEMNFLVNYITHFKLIPNRFRQLHREVLFDPKRSFDN